MVLNICVTYDLMTFGYCILFGNIFDYSHLHKGVSSHLLSIALINRVYPITLHYPTDGDGSWVVFKAEWGGLKHLCETTGSDIKLGSKAVISGG